MYFKLIHVLREKLIVAALVQNLFSGEVALIHATDLSRGKEKTVPMVLSNLDSIRGAAQEVGAEFLVASQQAKSRSVTEQEMRGMTYGEELEYIRRRLEENGAIVYLEARFLIHNDIMNGLRRWAEGNDLPFIDVIQAMDERRDLLTSWVHLNAEGNAIVAAELGDIIFDRVCGQKGIDAPPQN